MKLTTCCKQIFFLSLIREVIIIYEHFIHFTSTHFPATGMCHLPSTNLQSYHTHKIDAHKQKKMIFIFYFLFLIELLHNNLLPTWNMMMKRWLGWCTSMRYRERCVCVCSWMKIKWLCLNEKTELPQTTTSW